MDKCCQDLQGAFYPQGQSLRTLTNKSSSEMKSEKRNRLNVKKYHSEQDKHHVIICGPTHSKNIVSAFPAVACYHNMLLVIKAT